jgi:hypothetical protein
MARIHVFGDESGNFHFVRQPHASKYFIVCTVSMSDCSIGAKLLDLRRELVWKKMPVKEAFHASEDSQEIRSAVFETITKCDFRIQASILEKSKAQPQVRPSEERFYHYGWFYHLKFVVPKIIKKDDEALFTTAKVKTKKKQAAFTHAVNDSIAQTIGGKRWATHFCFSAQDPCLQVVDYCAWALQKKWETNSKELRPYNLIRDRINHEADIWSHGNTHHY